MKCDTCKFLKLRYPCGAPHKTINCCALDPERDERLRPNLTMEKAEACKKWEAEK